MRLKLETNWAVLGCSCSDWALLGFTGLYWATGLYWVVMSCAQHCWAATARDEVDGGER